MQERDIDLIIAAAKAKYPLLTVEQLKVSHLGVDDDGVWIFNEPSSLFQVQIESGNGTFPFLVETDCHNDRIEVDSVSAALRIIEEWLGLSDGTKRPWYSFRWQIVLWILLPFVIIAIADLLHAFYLAMVQPK